MAEQKISKSIVNSMMKVLDDSLKTDQTLAKDLISFLKDRGVNIPGLYKKGANKTLPVSFTKSKSDVQMDRLKNSFQENDLNENIL